VFYTLFVFPSVLPLRILLALLTVAPAVQISGLCIPGDRQLAVTTPFTTDTRRMAVMIFQLEVQHSIYASSLKFG
jgi:hypothetical protein